MSRLNISGGRKLFGSVSVHGAKNSVLPVLAATIINSGESVIHNCPDLTDVGASIKILEHLGCRVKREDDTICVDSSSLEMCEIPDSLMREMRSSVIFLGAILARTGHAVMTYPGGCELGSRPVDLHLEALRKLGVEISEREGKIYCTSAELRGCPINLDFPSVGATENIMLAACGAKGTTTITNAAREPEIIDLQDFLISMGADIQGAGSSTIVIEGVERFGNAEHRVIADRIAAATFLACAASAGGEVTVERVQPRHFETVTDILTEAGCDIYFEADKVTIVRRKKLNAVRPVRTKPYPGFPTDAQPPLMAALLKAKGTSVFVENIFENRYRHVNELLRMGADIKVEGKVALVCGTERLHGAPVKCTDLRGGAALVIAALGAEGESEISDLAHIDRGYHGFAENLKRLGADVMRI